MDDIEELCERNDLRIVRPLPNRGGASLRVLQVETPSGEMLVLKQTLPTRSRAEIACLRAWNETKVTARLLDVLTPDCYLIEFIEGPTLADVGNRQNLAAVGKALRLLHAVEPPATLANVDDLLTEDVQGWDRLLPEQRQRAVEAVSRLRQSNHAQLLHADLVPANVILSLGGPKVIDPVGRLGGAEWDVAQLVVTFFGRFGEICLAELLEGYGEPPALLPQMLAWMTLRYLQKNRAEGRPDFAKRLERWSGADVISSPNAPASP
jgi:streptomycin 6-kinase